MRINTIYHTGKYLKTISDRSVFGLTCRRRQEVPMQRANPKVIDVLNEVLTAELTAINQYLSTRKC